MSNIKGDTQEDYQKRLQERFAEMRLQAKLKNGKKLTPEESIIVRDRKRAKALASSPSDSDSFEYVINFYIKMAQHPDTFSPYGVLLKIFSMFVQYAQLSPRKASVFYKKTITKDLKKTEWGKLLVDALGMKAEGLKLKIEESKKNDDKVSDVLDWLNEIQIPQEQLDKYK